LSGGLKPTVPTVSISATIAGLHGTLGEAVRASRDIEPLRATMFEDFMIEQKKAPAVAQEQEREMDEESENQSFVPVQSAGDRRMDYCRVMTRSNATMALLIAMADETNEFERGVQSISAVWLNVRNIGRGMATRQLPSLKRELHGFVRSKN
jgi:hypothetical protein